MSIASSRGPRAVADEAESGSKGEAEQQQQQLLHRQEGGGVFDGHRKGEDGKAVPGEGASLGLANASWVAVCLLLYCTAGPATIFLNQYVLTRVHFPFPAALSLLGVSMSSVAASALLGLGVVPSSHLSEVTVRFYLVRVAPIGLALAGTLATGNQVYLHLSIAFIQILKSLSPVILLLLLWLLRLEKPRAVLGVAVGVIVVGMTAATQGELRVTLWGLCLMFLSELCDAIKAINMQILLSDKKFDSFESLAVFGPAAILGLATVAYLTEDYAAAASVVASNPAIFAVVSVSGLGVNLATNMYIKATSALTLRITSLARNVVIVLLAATFRHDSDITKLEFGGYLISLTGVALYNYARINADATVASTGAVIAARLRRCCTR